MAEQDHAEQGAATVAETPQITTFEDLACWKKCRELRLFVAKEAIPALPKEERYRLGEQLLRAARSTTANIAEGYGRDSRGAYVQHLRIAQGSLKEFETHLLLSERVELLDKTVLAPLLAKAELIGKMLRSLIRSIESSKKPGGSSQ